MVTSWLLIVSLGVWFAAAAAAQIRVSCLRRLRRWDPCQLLPRWNLFSPRPIQYDLVLRYRRWESSTEPGEWSPVPYPAVRRLSDGVFSPHRRSKRILYAEADRVVKLYRANPKNPRRIVTSTPYLHLLAYVTRQAGSDPSWGVQFQVVRTSGITGKPISVPLFRSAIHAM